MTSLMSHDRPVPAPQKTRISCSINFDEEGMHTGFLSIPHSTHESAYGRIQVPVFCLANGNGPTALLIAGNHGDEYEGQVALTALCHELDWRDIHGRVLALPALNLPAVRAARRESPLDGGNMNRSFPGVADGTPTAMLAHYVEHVLLPMADAALDLHSGGSSLVYQPCTLIREDAEPRGLSARQFELMRAFGGKYGYVTDGRNQGAERTFAAAAHRQRVACVTAELGGGAAISIDGVKLAREGVLRTLQHLGIVPAHQVVPIQQDLQLMTVESAASYVLAPDAGVFEPLVVLGQEVLPGQLAGRLWFPETPWRTPEPVNFANGGHVICQRSVAWAHRGDCLYQVLAPYAGELLDA